VPRLKDTGALPRAFLSKPFTPEILVKVVQRAFADRRQQLKPSRSGARVHGARGWDTRPLTRIGPCRNSLTRATLHPSATPSRCFTGVTIVSSLRPSGWCMSRQEASKPVRQPTPAKGLLAPERGARGTVCTRPRRTPPYADAVGAEFDEGAEVRVLAEATEPEALSEPTDEAVAAPEPDSSPDSRSPSRTTSLRARYLLDPCG
jgi:hypothetical protein